VFHRCVVAVIGVLAISTSAAAGPIKFDEKAPSFEAAELRSLDAKELRALFFRGGGARNAAASCADCVSNQSSLNRNRDSKSTHYTAAFPFTAARLFKKPAANRSSRRPAARVPDLLAGPAAASSDAVGAVPLSSSEGASPLGVVSPAAVPEPSTLALIGTGLAGAWLLRRRRGSQQASSQQV
jgi:hypothetical protein